MMYITSPDGFIIECTGVFLMDLLNKSVPVPEASVGSINHKKKSIAIRKNVDSEDWASDVCYNHHVCAPSSHDSKRIHSCPKCFFKCFHLLDVINIIWRAWGEAGTTENEMK